jgi:hypothetical protein
VDDWGCWVWVCWFGALLVLLLVAVKVVVFVSMSVPVLARRMETVGPGYRMRPASGVGAAWEFVVRLPAGMIIMGSAMNRAAEVALVPGGRYDSRMDQVNRPVLVLRGAEVKPVFSPVVVLLEPSKKSAWIRT